MALGDNDEPVPSSSVRPPAPRCWPWSACASPPLPPCPRPIVCLAVGAAAVGARVGATHVAVSSTRYCSARERRRPGGIAVPLVAEALTFLPHIRRQRYNDVHASLTQPQCVPRRHRAVGGPGALGRLGESHLRWTATL